MITESGARLAVCGLRVLMMPGDDVLTEPVARRIEVFTGAGRRRQWSAEAKAQIVKEFKVHDKDTGSPEVQVALLTDRISHLTEHLKVHKGDHHTRRGLMKLIGQRRRLLDYVQKGNVERYRALIGRLGIRR